MARRMGVEYANLAKVNAVATIQTAITVPAPYASPAPIAPAGTMGKASLEREGIARVGRLGGHERIGAVDIGQKH